MYKTGTKAVETARELADLSRGVSGVDIMIAPTALSLPLVAEALKEDPIRIGAQNLHMEQQGAFTGEVSAEMIRAAGADCVIIGHSERRQYFGETDASVSQKVKAAVRAGLTPVVCIGETEMKEMKKKPFLCLTNRSQMG